MQGRNAPVHEAATENDVEALAALLDEEPSLLHAWDRLYMLSPHSRGQPLHFACYAGSVEAVGFLLDRGACVFSTHPQGELQMTPLLAACRAGHAAVVSLLLARGADPTLRNEIGETVLMEAISVVDISYPGSDRVAVIRQLLEDGRVPVDAQDKDGYTALWLACLLYLVEVARVLLVEGRADHTIADHEGERPVDVARFPAPVRLIRVR